MPLLSEHNKLNKLDKPQLQHHNHNLNKALYHNLNKALYHNLNRALIEIVVRLALQGLHHYIEGILVIVLA